MRLALSSLRAVHRRLNDKGSHKLTLLTTRSKSTMSSGPIDSSRATELAENIKDVRERMHQACLSRSSSGSSEESRSNTTIPQYPTLVAVSKFKPASDTLACYELGHRDFGENYVQELTDKAKELPEDIKWHFIGTLQSNKAKVLSSIPNLYAIQTISSTKTAEAVNKALPEGRATLLNVLLQVNTSGEDSKSGLEPLKDTSPDNNQDLRKSDLYLLVRHIITNCPRLHFQGLMTIGALSESLSPFDENRDFDTLSRTRDVLERLLREDNEGSPVESSWGERNGDSTTRRLVLSMGMSSDFEAALRAGSDIVRVGTGIFGARPKKNAA